MSSLGSGRPLKGYVRDSRRRKMVLDVDLNDMPPLEGRTEEETSAGIVLQEVRSVEPGGVLPPATTIDVEAIDDEVVISSPRSFEEARNKSRRNHGVTVVIDEDIEVQQGHSDIQFTRLAHNRYTKRRSIPPNQTIISYDFFINLDGGHSTEKNHVKSPEPSQSMPQPKEPTFSCPVCMGPLNEEMSTKCGHIFCKKCIKAAITAQHKCPTCRRKLTMRDILRVYLPATS